MGKVQRFERRLQGMVGDAFARVFGGSVVPQEVAQALQREAEDNARPLAGGRVLAPNRYTVTLGPADHDRLVGDEQRVIRMLKDCVQSHLAERAWDAYGDVVVALRRSETLHTGQFRTSSSVDPDSPHPRTAGDRAMSQHQGEYAGDAQRGQHRHDTPSGAAPDYGQPPGYDQYSYDQYGYEQPGSEQPGYEQPEYGYDQGVDRGQLSASLSVDDGSNRHHQLTEGATVVGRGQEAQFRLPDTGVSRRHLEITWDGQRATLADLGSTNGTTVNGTPVQTWQLADGDVVRVGQSRLVFRTQG
ncbi:MAG: DUF3662 and FHA domain-containing protein [Pseudonocardiaceae bacterium]